MGLYEVRTLWTRLQVWCFCLWRCGVMYATFDWNSLETSDCIQDCWCCGWWWSSLWKVRPESENISTCILASTNSTQSSTSKWIQSTYPDYRVGNGHFDTDVSVDGLCIADVVRETSKDGDLHVVIFQIGAASARYEQESTPLQIFNMFQQLGKNLRINDLKTPDYYSN